MRRGLVRWEPNCFRFRWWVRCSRSSVLVSAARHGCLIAFLVPRVPASIEPGTHVLRLLNQVTACEGVTLASTAQLTTATATDRAVARSDSTSVACVFTAAALVPSPPLLVPQLSGDSAEAEEVRTAVLKVVRDLAAMATKWIAVGIDTGIDQGEESRDGVARGEIGTFAGFGVDVHTRLDAAASGPVNPQWPLAALVAGWLREQVEPAVSIDLHLISADATISECRSLGSKVRAQLDDDSEPVGLLVLADGASTLTLKAPGSFDARAAAVQSVVDAALSGGDRAALQSVDPVLCAAIGMQGRAAWQVLATVFTEEPRAVVGYSGAPFGVGYHVGMWRP